MKINASNRLNALKTGMFAREILLPWEDAAELEKVCTGIFNDVEWVGEIEKRIVTNIAENLWMRERQRHTSAIATHRHAFGQVIENSGAKTWRDALSVVCEHNVESKKALQTIAKSMIQVAKTVACWNKKLEGPADFKKLEKILDACIKIEKRLGRLEIAVDEEREFFAEYSPKNLEQRIRIENSLDAQFDKLFGRLERVQEARILRDKLRKNKKTVSSPSIAHDSVGTVAETQSDDGRAGLGLTDLDRDDDDI